jgi:UDP-N-acetylmuramoyl-tripeptide--D-alanyl-D-alanine ligase
MTLWTRREIWGAQNGEAWELRGDWTAGGVSIDTRSLQKGDIFIALKDQRDGHDFVANAMAKGAAVAMVSHIPEGLPDDVPLWIVPDVFEGLTRFGALGRARAKGQVVGVTGSVGKTSTKEMLRAILSGQGKTHAAEASYNNHWGVPLTLARLPKDADFAVIEIGMNHPGEIAPLAELARLHVAMITTVAPAHLEAFGSLEAIAEEKAAIFKGLIRGGVAVIPEGLAVTPILRRAAEAAGAEIRSFGDATGDYRLLSVQTAEGVTIARAMTPSGERLFKVQSPGRHFAVNALGALAVADALGLDPAIAAGDLGRWQPPAGRGLRETILLDPVERHGFDLIDDAFNSNPASLAAALDILIEAEPKDGPGRFAKGRRVAILGDMLELGPTEAALHRAVADHPGLAKIDLIHCVGPRMKALHAVLPRVQAGEWVETAAELAPRLRGLVDAGDVILVKGSKGIKVSALVDGLRKMGQRAQPDF